MLHETGDYIFFFGGIFLHKNHDNFVNLSQLFWIETGDTHTHTQRQRQNADLVRTFSPSSMKQNRTDCSRLVFGRFGFRISAGKQATLTEVFRSFIEVSTLIRSKLISLASFTIQSFRASSLHILHMKFNTDLLIFYFNPRHTSVQLIPKISDGSWHMQQMQHGSDAVFGK
jgi:hypothetical protein